MCYVELDMAKKHLNVESDFVDDDGYIQMLIDVAEAKVAKELCVSVKELATIGGGDTIPEPLKHAILLNIGGYYANREEMSNIQSRELAQGARYIISLYRNYQL